MFQSPQHLGGRPCPCSFLSGLFQCWLLSVKRLLLHGASGALFLSHHPWAEEVAKSSNKEDKAPSLSIPGAFFSELSLWGNGLLRSTSSLLPEALHHPLFIKTASIFTLSLTIIYSRTTFIQGWYVIAPNPGTLDLIACPPLLGHLLAQSMPPAFSQQDIPREGGCHSKALADFLLPGELDWQDTGRLVYMNMGPMLTYFSSLDPSSEACSGP